MQRCHRRPLAALLGVYVASCFVGPSIPRTAPETSTLVSDWAQTLMVGIETEAPTSATFRPLALGLWLGLRRLL